MNKKYPKPEHQDLYKTILKLESLDEAVDFFRDLLTIKEINEFSRRWQVAKLLHQGIPYAKIAKKVGVSTTTVSRVAQWLNHGRGGYKNILKKS